MSKTVLHGENITASRNRLAELLIAAKEKKYQITHIEGNKLNQLTTELLLGENSLFAEPRLVVIEELHSLPLGKKRDGLVAQIATLEDKVILWEKKKLTTLMLKKLGADVKAEVFEPSKNLWKLLAIIGVDSHKSLTLYQEIIEQEDAFYLLNLFTRQIRLLIQILTGPEPRLAPFQVAQLRSQSKNIPLSCLLQAHQRLLEIEFNQKTGTALLPLGQELFLWLHSIN